MANVSAASARPQNAAGFLLFAPAHAVIGQANWSMIFLAQPWK